MRDNSTLAKLIAEEDISVVHKKVPTAAFDVKRRELILPQWKEMPKTIQDLMTLHEAAHALWTSLGMLEKMRERKIEKSFVNVIEDARIEKMIQNKYAGSRKTFRLGYAQLIARDFFKTQGKNLNLLSLIDRINLHFKKTPDIQFTPEEQVWVNRVAACNTEDDVLNTAEDLYKWMQENPESQEQEQPQSQSDELMEDYCDEWGMESSDETESSDEETEVTEGAEGETEETKESSTQETDEDGEKPENQKTVNAGGAGKLDTPITATTDDASSESAKEMLDNESPDIGYYQVPKSNLKNIIVSSDEIVKELDQYWSEQSPEAYDKSKTWYQNDLTKLKLESKKTISYMVKEFEMKKAADQYARASTSKTGKLDLSKVHTYKYNDDLFAKVTTLPGATSHGMVIFLDWSGSMYCNIEGTVKQLYNLVWFCQRVKIPFEVYAFSDYYRRDGQENVGIDYYQKPKVNDLSLDRLQLLNFLSSNMSTNEFNEAILKLHTLVGSVTHRCRYSRRNGGRPYLPNPRNFDLYGTPLDTAIIAAMDVLPKFKSETGVQKVNTIFLTDGDSQRLDGFVEIPTEDDDEREYKQGYISPRDDMIVTDPVTGAKLRKTFYKVYNRSDFVTRSQKTTAFYLSLLKQRVPNMNLVGFFIAGSGRNGTVPRRVLEEKFGVDCDFKKIRKELKKNNVAVCKSAGYDEYYILPSMDIDLENKGIEVEVGASKSALKSAFKKNATSKTVNRPLLNKFIGMVA